MTGRCRSRKQADASFAREKKGLTVGLSNAGLQEPCSPRCLLLLGVFLLLATPNALAELSYQEGIHLIRPDSRYIDDTYAIPEYLTVEDITFASCLEEDLPLRNSILCLDDNSFEDLPVIKWSTLDNCYVSSYNLEDFECERLQLQAEYTKDGETYKFTKLVRVNKFSTVLDKIVATQYSDGGWKDPLSTTYAIWALSSFKEIYTYELEEAMDWLKANRNNEKKCWPKSPCNVELSANILALLTLSNYTDARRVVNDARNWMEELQNDYSQGDRWNATVHAVTQNTTLVLVSYDQTVLDENFTIPLDTPKEYSFLARTGKRLIVISDDYVTINVTNQENDTLVAYQGDNLSYIIPGPCWSLNRKGEPCDITTSLFVMATPIDEDQLDHAKDWARTQVREGNVLGTYIGDSTTVTDTAFYLYDLYEDDEDEEYMDRMIDWTLYTQNNEGSWGPGSTDQKAIPTAHAVLGLLAAGYNRSTEPIQDAEEWMSDNEDNLTRNNTKALGSAFYVLRHHARPALAANPKVLVIEKSATTIELFNPTTFNLRNLSYEFTDGIDDYLTIEPREEIDAYSYRKLRVDRSGAPTVDLYGFLVAKNAGGEVARIPVLLTNTPTINLTIPSMVTVFGRSADIKIPVTKSAHEFICVAKWSSGEISSPGSIKVKGKELVLPISFVQAMTKEDSYTGTLACTAAGKETSFPISVFITRFSDEPLTLTPEDALVNQTGTSIVFTLRNNLDRDVDVKIAMDRYASYFGFRTNILLGPNQEENITFTNKLPPDLNLTSTAIVQFTAFNRTVTASMLIDMSNYEPPKKSIILVLLPYLIVLAVLGGLGYLGWKFRDILIAELNKLNFVKIRTQKKSEVAKIKTVKRSEQHQAIINIYNIMKFQNKDERDIAARLLKSFSREDIKTALQQAGAALPILDEEAPKKA